MNNATLFNIHGVTDQVGAVVRVLETTQLQWKVSRMEGTVHQGRFVKIDPKVSRSLQTSQIRDRKIEEITFATLK